MWKYFLRFYPPVMSNSLLLHPCCMLLLFLPAVSCQPHGLGWNCCKSPLYFIPISSWAGCCCPWWTLVHSPVNHGLNPDKLCHHWLHSWQWANSWLTDDSQGQLAKRTTCLITQVICCPICFWSYLQILAIFHKLMFSVSAGPLAKGPPCCTMFLQ